jgi:hypothetical protein
MNQPQEWECKLYEKIHATLKEGGKTFSSYYLSVDESVRQCKKIKEQPK